MNEPNEASLSITESSQEWHILNLLRVGERDLFETNFQEFRKIQLTESQDGKVRLCKLINEILRLDPQYSIILVEDLSHLFNDSNFVVQKSALFSIADSLSILFSHIVASNALVEGFKATGSLDSCKFNHMGRCRSNQSWINTGHYNHFNGLNTPSNIQTDNPEVHEDLPFSLDNVRVFESFSDFACIRFMTHIRLLEESFADVKYKTLHGLHYLIHTRTRFYSVNLLKLLFFELSNYPNYLCRECTDNSHNDSNMGENELHKSPKGSKAKKKGVEQSEEPRFDMHDTLYKWHKESVQLLQHLISTYLESYKKDKSKASGSKFFKSKQSDGDKGADSEGKLVGCILASEVAACLICFYPDFYFNSFADFLVPLLATSHSVVFENILFRIFSTDKCVNYHHQLLLKVNEYGYDLDLTEVYRLVQTLPSRYRENRRGSMVVVNKNEGLDKNKQFDVTDKLVSCLEVDSDPSLSEYPAAQLFEFDKELVKNYRKIKTSQIKIDRNFYKNKPAEMTPILYPAPYTVHAGDADLKRKQESDTAQTDYDHYNAFTKKPKELTTVTDELIANNEKLFVRLVGCQMIDTAATYKRFLRFEVIGPKLVRFDLFSKAVLNHLLLSNIVEFENRKEVLCNLLNHLAEHVLVNNADLSFFRQHRDFDQMTYGLSALFTYVNHVKDVELFVKYLNHLNNLVVYSYTTNLAKSLVTYRNNKQIEDDYFMTMYENFVNLSLSYVCEFLSEMGEYGDFCVHALSKFVLNLPKVPSRIADLIVLWVNSDKQGNVKLAFSLVSNLLKLSESVTRVDFSSLLGSHYYKYTSNLSFVRRSIFVVFLSCITSDNQTVSELFLKLISSQKGLYTTNYSYTLKRLQSLHEEFVEDLNRHKESSGAETSHFHEDCLYLSDRPVWQWPTKLVQSVCESGKYKSFSELVDLINGASSDDTDALSADHDDLDTNDQLKLHMYYSDDSEDVNDDIGAWIEESVTLMSIPNSLKSSKFIHNTARNLVKLGKSADKSDPNHMESGDANDMNVDKPDAASGAANDAGDDSNMEMDDSDDDMVIYDDDAEEPEKPGPAPTYLYYEPMLACCSKSARLVFRLADLATKCAGTAFYTKCSQTLPQYPRELQILIKYSDEYSEFVESALRETRKRWSDLMFKYERTSLDKELMLLLIAKMSTLPEYLIQMSPFLARDQLDALMVYLFKNNEKEKLIKILDTIIETPKIVLPQHFLYSTYNFQVSATASTDKEKEYMKLQVSLLDTCITYCTHGKFSVESAISSLYLIVESFENINFVFGRLLCQFVQKIPLTRKVIVDVIFPKLIQKQCWQDKQLFKGVVLSICALWNQFKDQLVRHILEMPNSNIKMVLRALQSQHNISDYFKSSSVPSSLQALYEEVAASSSSKPT